MCSWVYWWAQEQKNNGKFRCFIREVLLTILTKPASSSEVGKLSNGAATIHGARGRRAVLRLLPLLLESGSLELRRAAGVETAARRS